MQKTAVILALLLASCTATAQTRGPLEAGDQSRGVPLSQLDPDFLYLAAVQARDNDNDALAISFMKAVVDKDPEAVLPRLQLAEMLLQNGRATEAKEPLDQLLAIPELGKDDRNTVRMLQVQMLVLDDHADEAVVKLRAILREQPDAYPARLLLIRLLTSERHFDEAQRVISEGLKDEKNPQLYHIQAQLFIHAGKYDEAEKSLSRLMQLEPDQSGPVLMYSQLAKRRNRPADAEKVLRSFLKDHPDSLNVSNALGRLLVEQGRGKEAIEIYHDIAERTDGDPDVLIALGLLYYQEGDYEDAEASFRRVLDERKDARAEFYLAASLEALGKQDAARTIYKRIKANDANFAMAQLRLAGIDLREDRRDAALVTLRQLIRVEPRLTQAYTLLSAVLMRQKAYRQLLNETEPALSLPDVQVQLLFNRAAAFEALKQYNDAAGQIKKLFNIEPDNVEALNFLGYLYAEQGVKLDEAEKLIRRALKQSPDNGYYLDSLAWVHYQRAEYAKALEVQREAVDHVPNDPIMREHLGDILWKNGKQDEARATWKEAIRLGHENTPSMQHKIDKGL